MAKLRLEILALCDYADFTKSGKFVLSGIFDQIYTKALQAPVFPRCYVAFTLSGNQKNIELPVKLKINDPQGKKLIEQDLSVPFGNNGKGNFTLELVGFPVDTVGIYTISILHLDKELGFTNFEVMQAPPNAK